MDGRNIDRRSFVVGTAATAATLAAGPAIAQDAYPSRPVTFVNPFPPGGATDVVGRPFAAAIEPFLKQPALVDTKPGAAGAVGALAAAAPGREPPYHRVIAKYRPPAIRARTVKAATPKISSARLDLAPPSGPGRCRPSLTVCPRRASL